MAKRRDRLDTWEPSPQQTYAALLLARMNTWKETAAQVEVDISAIARWSNIPEFRALVDMEVRAYRESLDNETMAATLEAITVFRQMLRAEIPADDKRLKYAAPVATDIIKSSVAYTDAPPDVPARVPGLAVQFNVNGGGQPEQRISPPTDVTPD